MPTMAAVAVVLYRSGINIHTMVAAVMLYNSGINIHMMACGCNALWININAMAADTFVMRKLWCVFVPF